MSPKAATIEYGQYILSYQDCRSCHGANLGGGVQGQFGPVGPGLALVKEWKLEDFISTLRTGIDPTGHHLDEKRMPWRAIGRGTSLAKAGSRAMLHAPEASTTARHRQSP